MKAPLSWLKEYVDITLTPQELEKILISIGFEVEELLYLGKDVNNVVVGQITQITKHQNSDHLLVCQVNVGDKTLQIVTGANNVFEGALVPVALDGATLPNGKVIKNGVLRGVESCGMLVSGEELGINDDWYDGASVDGILILSEGKLGQDIKELVGLNDYIYDIGVTANRPDCQSVYGIAREIAAALKQTVKLPITTYNTTSKNNHSLSVEVLDYDLCPKYMAHLVTDIKIEQSPLWLRKKLALYGINSINNIVDITNYVLLELGQPMHAFDLTNLFDNKIIVRRAKPNESITTLDEKEFKLTKNNLVICDNSKPVALAGIMGGLNSEIKPSTTNVVFESAKFARDNVRKTSRALGQSSDSSRRFEKGVDEFTVEQALNRALSLVQQLNCGTITAVRFDKQKEQPKEQVLTVTQDRINKVLGITISVNDMVDILTRLQFKVVVNNNNLTVTVPPFRQDLESNIDLAEEIIRLYGYHHIVPTDMEHASVTNGGLTQKQKDIRKLKSTLVLQGFFETMSYAFYSNKDLDMLKLTPTDPYRNAIKILNPISEDLSILRTTLVPTTINTLVRNMKKNVAAYRVFEVANIFKAKSLPVTELPTEELMLSLGAYGEKESFFTLKGAIENLAQVFGLNLTYSRANLTFLHPGISAVIMCNNQEIGFVGQLAYDIANDISATSNIFVAELSFDKMLTHITNNLKFAPLPKHLEVTRDIAILVQENITHEQIERVIYSSNPFVSNVKLFDIYQGKQIEKGYKSMAYTLTLTPKENVFSLEDIDNHVKEVLASLSKQLKVELR